MSVIVYRDGVMAADTRAYSGDATPIGHKMKIFRLKDGSLVGFSTTKPGLSEAMVAWFNAESPEGPPPVEMNFSALLVKPNGEVFYYNDSISPSGPLVGPYFAVGSGDHYALGALACGAAATEAVEVACQFDPWCALPVAALALADASEVQNDPSRPPCPEELNS